MATVALELALSSVGNRLGLKQLSASIRSIIDGIQEEGKLDKAQAKLIFELHSKLVRYERQPAIENLRRRMMIVALLHANELAAGFVAGFQKEMKDGQRGRELWFLRQVLDFPVVAPTVLDSTKYSDLVANALSSCWAASTRKSVMQSILRHTQVFALRLKKAGKDEEFVPKSHSSARLLLLRYLDVSEKVILDDLKRIVFDAKTPLGKAELASCRVVAEKLSSATAEELGGQVSRALRRRPEVVLPALAALTEGFSFDVSKFLKEVAEPLFEESQKGKEGSSDRAAEAIRNLLVRSSDKEALLATLEVVKKSVSQPRWHNSASVQTRSHTYGMLCAVLGGDGIPKTVRSILAAEVGSIAVNALSKESNEDAVFKCVEAVGASLRATGDSAHGKALADLLFDKSETRRKSALIQLSRSLDFATEAVASESVAKLIDSAIAAAAKPITAAESALTASFVIRLCSLQPSLGKPLENDKFVNAVALTEGKGLLDASLISRLRSEEEAKEAVHAFSYLLRHFEISQKFDAMQVLARQTVLLCTAFRDVSQAATSLAIGAKAKTILLRSLLAMMDNRELLPASRKAAIALVTALSVNEGAGESAASEGSAVGQLTKSKRTQKKVPRASVSKASMGQGGPVKGSASLKLQKAATAAAATTPVEGAIWRCAPSVLTSDALTKGTKGVPPPTQCAHFRLCGDYQWAAPSPLQDDAKKDEKKGSALRPSQLQAKGGKGAGPHAKEDKMDEKTLQRLKSEAKRREEVANRFHECATALSAVRWCLLALSKLGLGSSVVFSLSASTRIAEALQLLGAESAPAPLEGFVRMTGDAVAGACQALGTKLGQGGGKMVLVSVPLKATVLARPLLPSVVALLKQALQAVLPGGTFFKPSELPMFFLSMERWLLPKPKIEARALPFVIEMCCKIAVKSAETAKFFERVQKAIISAITVLTECELEQKDDIDDVGTKENLHLEKADMVTSVCNTLISLLLHRTSVVRSLALSGLKAVVSSGVLDRLRMALPPTAKTRLWVVMADEVEECAEAAGELWDSLGFSIVSGDNVADGKPAGFLLSLLSLYSSCEEDVLDMWSKAIADTMDEIADEKPEIVGEVRKATLTWLFALFTESQPKEIPVADLSKGMTEEEALATLVVGAEAAGALAKQDKRRFTENLQGRIVVAIALKGLAEVITARELPVVLTFMLNKGFLDESIRVRQLLLAAGVALVKAHGEKHSLLIFPLLEHFLEQKDSTSEAQDHVREAAVIFSGHLAQYLPKESDKFKRTVGVLIEVLRTPSEPVQASVGKCLGEIFPQFLDAEVTMGRAQDKAEAARPFINDTMNKLLSDAGFAVRRGAAFGVAGLVKGYGLGALKQFEIMNKLIEAASSNVSERKQSAMFAFECLSGALGRLFEPYVVHVLPLLLSTLGDKTAAVRESAEMAADAIMGSLSSQGVKLVLPTLLKGLEERQWRSKVGSVELLGAMTACAPKQLASCLPQLVPNLAEALTDSHAKVREAAHSALERIGKVIRNPEINSMAPILLQAIGDPLTHTQSALEQLVKTRFVNAVDSASLAILVPILVRGLKDRIKETKKRAAQVVGSMLSLVTDVEDVVPYLPQLLPPLRTCLFDPLPEVRTTVAGALGRLLRHESTTQVGDALADQREETMNWLMDRVKTGQSGVERSGAAHGYCEVLSSANDDVVAKVVSDVTVGVNVAESAREGYFYLLMHLPKAIGDRMLRHLDATLAAIVQGFSDQSESVRTVAVNAGRQIVHSFAEKSSEQLLTALENGLTHENWRIRGASVSLIGDFLYFLVGLEGRGKDSHVEDAGGVGDIGMESHADMIDEAIGRERRQDVLAGVFMMKSDVNPSVQSTATQVWKTVVSNTPKTIREILPTLLKKIVESLSQGGEENRALGSRALGDLVQRLGNSILTEILPVIERGLKHGGETERQGLCLGLLELIAAAPKPTIKATDSLPHLVLLTLKDKSAFVRASGGESFTALHDVIGNAAVVSVINPLLQSIIAATVAGREAEGDELKAKAQEERERYLDGLRNAMFQKAGAILPQLLPTLLSKPISMEHAEALASLTKVAKEAISDDLSDVLEDLVDTLVTEEEGSEAMVSIKNAADSVVLAMSKDALPGVVTYLTKIMAEGDLVTESSMKRKAIGADLLATLFRDGKASAVEGLYTEEALSVIEAGIPLMDAPSKHLVSVTWAALSSIIERMGEVRYELIVPSINIGLDTLEEERRQSGKSGDVFGFSIPNGVKPFFTALHSVTNAGTAAGREKAAEAIGRISSVTSAAGLKPHMMKIVGPLIRVLGENFPWQVKAAILSAIVPLVDKSHLALKAMLTQIQRAVVTSLSDKESTTVRSRAIRVLKTVAPLTPKPDVLFTEIVKGAKAAKREVRAAHLKAFRSVCETAADKPLDKAIPVVEEMFEALFEGEEDADAVLNAAEALEAWGQRIGAAAFSERFLSLFVRNLKSATWKKKMAALAGAVTVVSVLGADADEVQETSQIVDEAIVAVKDEQAMVREIAGSCIVKLMATESSLTASKNAKLASALFTALKDSCDDVPISIFTTIASLSAAQRGVFLREASGILDALSLAAKEANTFLRTEAERSLVLLFDIPQKGLKGVEAAASQCTDSTVRNVVVDIGKRLYKKGGGRQTATSLCSTSSTLSLTRDIRTNFAFIAPEACRCENAATKKKKIYLGRDGTEILEKM